MTNSGDAAEQVVRLSLEGFEVAARLTGSAAKNIAILLASVLKQEATQANKTRGKARLTNMIKSGKELKVFSIPNKDLKKLPNRQNATVFSTVFFEIRTQRERIFRLILLPVRKTLLKFKESLNDLNSVRWIRRQS